MQAGSALFDGRGLCWLLIRISVQLERLPRWGEILTVDTWHRGVQKLVFIRDFVFYDQQGIRLGQATSEWLIASQDTHRPQRPDQTWPEGSRPNQTRPALTLACPRLAPLDPLPPEPVLVKYADFSDIDRNHHVNNTRYVAWCMDAVYSALIHSRPAAAEDLAAGLMVRRFDIQYQQEVRLGTKLQLYCSQAGDSGRDWQVEAHRSADGARLFQARIRLDLPAAGPAVQAGG